MHPARCADSGIFSLGSPSLDRHAMEYIMKRYPVRTDDIIISGTGIAAFAAISSLINMGIASNRITLLVKSEEQIVDETLDKFVSIYLYTFIFLYVYHMISFVDDVVAAAEVAVVIVVAFTTSLIISLFCCMSSIYQYC